MAKSFLIGIDQGTSGSKAVIIDREGCVCGFAYRPVTRFHPQPTWVEQDPAGVAQGVAEAICEAIGQAGCQPEEIAACGLASQRNTDFVWDGPTGRALANAITWQDLRIVPLLQQAAAWPGYEEIHYRLGYGPGAYMAALHLAWRLKEDRAVQEAAAAGRLRIGLSAAWLIQALGSPAGHFMDSSLTQALGLYDIRQGHYWPEWLQWLGVPEAPLPIPTPTLHDFGQITITAPSGKTANVPVLAMIGDQQAALFGQGCHRPGQAECTHGTASYIKVFSGSQAPIQNNIDVLCAWELAQTPTYCLEAATTVNGAAIRWMRDQLQFFDHYSQIDPLVSQITDSEGVIFVPAFTGLNAPYQNPQARATIFGLTLGHHKGHILRAFLESIGFQLRTILDLIQQDVGLETSQLLVGGGVSASNMACQIQADLLGIPVLRPTFTDTTALAAALLAGLGAGFWADPAGLPPQPGTYTCFDPQLTQSQRQDKYTQWQKAVGIVNGDR